MVICALSAYKQFPIVVNFEIEKKIISEEFSKNSVSVQIFYREEKYECK